MTDETEASRSDYGRVESARSAMSSAAKPAYKLIGNSAILPYSTSLTQDTVVSSSAFNL